MPLWVAVIVLLLVPGAVWMAGDWLGADSHEASALALVAVTGAALVLVEFGVRATEPLPLPWWVQVVTVTGPAVCIAVVVLWSGWRADAPASPTPVGHCARCGVPLNADHTGHRYYSQPADYLCPPWWWSRDGRRHLMTDAVGAAAPAP
jgi:hypothetical protein